MSNNALATLTHLVPKYSTLSNITNVSPEYLSILRRYYLLKPLTKEDEIVIKKITRLGSIEIDQEHINKQKQKIPITIEELHSNTIENIVKLYKIARHDVINLRKVYVRQNNNKSI